MLTGYRWTRFSLRSNDIGDQLCHQGIPQFLLFGLLSLSLFLFSEEGMYGKRKRRRVIEVQHNTIDIFLKEEKL